MTFLPVETVKIEGMRDTGIGELQKSVYRCSMSQVLDTADIIQVTSEANERWTKMRILHRSLRMVLDGPGPSYTAVFRATTERNVELNCFPILASYYCDIHKGKNVSRIRQSPPVRRSCIKFLSTMEYIREIRCMRGRIMADTNPAGAMREDLMSSLANSDSNITIEQRQTIDRLSKEALKEMQLSEWTSFMKGIQLVKADIVTSAYTGRF